jgi:hypothetical protein
MPSGTHWQGFGNYTDCSYEKRTFTTAGGGEVFIGSSLSITARRRAPKSLPEKGIKETKKLAPKKTA